MKLAELFEESSLATLQAKLDSFQTELAELMKVALGHNSSVIKPQYKNRIDQVKGNIKLIKKQLFNFDKDEADRKAAETDSRAFDQQFATQQANMTPEEKAGKFAAAISAGHEIGSKIRAKYDGWLGLAKHVEQLITTAQGTTNERITADYIVKQLQIDDSEITARTVNKWLERPEFTEAARLLGRR